jgi:hypothetical protein
MIFEKIILTVITIPFIIMLLYSFVYPEDVMKKKSFLHEEEDLTVKPGSITFTKWFSLSSAVITLILMTFYLYS